MLQFPKTKCLFLSDHQGALDSRSRVDCKYCKRGKTRIKSDPGCTHPPGMCLETLCDSFRRSSSPIQKEVPNTIWDTAQFLKIGQPDSGCGSWYNLSLKMLHNFQRSSSPIQSMAPDMIHICLETLHDFWRLSRLLSDQEALDDMSRVACKFCKTRWKSRWNTIV